MDSRALLSLNHLSVWYTAEHPVLSDFSLDLRAAEDQSFRYFTFREYLTYVAASYGVPLPDVSGLIRGFHFENYANVLLSVADLLPLPAIALARGVAAREMLVLPLRFLAMLLTVLLAVLAKVRAVGETAGMSWFSRHACRLLSDNRKAPKGLLL